MSKVEYDENLWFKVGHCAGIHYFIGNPHTFYGRMWAWCPDKQRTFFVSKNEVLECSVESKYWIIGFLNGNEPNPPVDNDYQTVFGTKEYKEWQQAINLFHETGFWYSEERICPKCNGTRLPSEIGDTCIKCANE